MDAAGISQDDLVSQEEMASLLDNETMLSSFRASRMTRNFPKDYTLSILGFSEADQALSLNAIIDACVKLSSGATDIRSFMMQHDVARLRKTIQNDFRIISESVDA